MILIHNTQHNLITTILQALQVPKYCEELALPNLCPTETDPRTLFDGK